MSDIIVIGGSAGSRVPLTQIVRALPRDLPASVIVVTHMATTPDEAGRENWLAPGLESAGVLPVRQGKDGEAILPGCITLAAPGRHLMLMPPGVIRLGTGPRENMARPAVDSLFRSAAVLFGPRVVGVVLSGMLNDGASGLEAIKRCGGVAVVQDPDDAAYASMPNAALAAVSADHCLPATEIGRLLATLAQAPLPAAPARGAPDDMRLEVEIAAGREEFETRFTHEHCEASVLTCPQCSGVLSEVRGQKPLRFRCQTGHALTAEFVLAEQERHVDEALRVALRVVQERLELVRRMASDAREAGRDALARLYDERTREYQGHVDTIRRAILKSFDLTGKEVGAQ